MLCYTRADYWGDQIKYIVTDVVGLAEKDNWHWPGFSRSAAEWILKHRPGINGLAVDTVSCDNGPFTGMSGYFCMG